MEPDLTDVGSTLEEALQLRQEHNEMLAKLKVNTTKGSLLKLNVRRNSQQIAQKSQDKTMSSRAQQFAHDAQVLD